MKKNKSQSHKWIREFGYCMGILERCERCKMDKIVALRNNWLVCEGEKND